MVDSSGAMIVKLKISVKVLGPDPTILSARATMEELKLNILMSSFNPMRKIFPKQLIIVVVFSGLEKVDHWLAAHLK